MLYKIKQFFKNIIIFHFLNLILELFPNHSFSNSIRGYVYSFFLKKAGKKLKIAKGIIINCKEKIEIGDNVYIAHDVWINGSGGLIIESNVIISPKVVIATTKHAYENGTILLKNGGKAPIVIGKGTWVASNSTITMGVSIGKGCIIAANSAISKDIPDYKLVGGVPGKVIKDLL
ncbi:acyltransferase [Acinetobacter haemolyticus]|uniref:acyltransferase n=1 Tax=Acinetobacter haemolyticus TaxID=29430 RepID=UPI003EF46E9D